jgi:rhamnulokinase
MWLLEQCRKEWKAAGQEYTYSEMTELSAATRDFRSLIDPDHPLFANPESMTRAIIEYCKQTKQEIPVNPAEFIHCIFSSLTSKYKDVLYDLQKVAPFRIEKLHIIGGGSQNRFLNQMTADATGIPVVAGPSEATTLGNVMMQAKGLGIVQSLQEIREIIRNSISPEVFFPKDSGR